MPLTALKCNYIKCKPSVITYRCFKHFDTGMFRQDLMHAFNASGINISYEVFEDTYLQKYIRGNDQPFMTKNMRKAIMLRTKLRNIYLQNPTEEKGLIFRKQRHYCVKLLKQTKKSYYENPNINIITDYRKFWKYIKPSFSDKIATFSNLILYDNEDIISKENDVAEIFNSYFSNIVNTLDITDMGNYNAYADDISNPILMAISKYSEHPSIVSIKNNCISDVKHSFSTLSHQDILNVIYDIDASKATASHNIPIGFLKNKLIYILMFTFIPPNICRDGVLYSGTIVAKKLFAILFDFSLS